MLYDREFIQTIIPHRDPFLLIDEIVSTSTEEGQPNCVAIKYVNATDDYFKGHFPEHPVMPGVLVLEAMAQTGAFFLLMMDEYKGKIAYFTGANNVKWRRQVVPGDKLELQIFMGSLRRGIGSGTARAYVDGQLACEAEIKFACM